MGAKKQSKSKTCIDCSSYLPVPPEELSEFGICLNDEAFEPFTEELGHIPSNNTTRQWISDILRFLERCPLQVIEAPLRSMLTNRKFSPGIRKRVAEILSGSQGP